MGTVPKPFTSSRAKPHSRGERVMNTILSLQALAAAPTRAAEEESLFSIVSHACSTKSNTCVDQVESEHYF
jgi:hypothetical protein